MSGRLCESYVFAVCEDMSQPLVVTQNQPITSPSRTRTYSTYTYPRTTHSYVLSHASRPCVIPLFELCTLYLARGSSSLRCDISEPKQQSTARHSLNASKLIVCTAVRLVGDLMTTEYHLLGMILDLSNIATPLRHPSLEWMAHQPAHILLF